LIAQLLHRKTSRSRHPFMALKPCRELVEWRFGVRFEDNFGGVFGALSIDNSVLPGAIKSANPYFGEATIFSTTFKNNTCGSGPWLPSLRFLVFLSLLLLHRMSADGPP
jgi:hypothetical protein